MYIFGIYTDLIAPLEVVVIYPQVGVGVATLMVDLVSAPDVEDISAPDVEGISALAVVVLFPLPVVGLFTLAVVGLSPLSTVLGSLFALLFSLLKVNIVNEVIKLTAIIIHIKESLFNYLFIFIYAFYV